VGRRHFVVRVTRCHRGARDLLRDAGARRKATLLHADAVMKPWRAALGLLILGLIGFEAAPVDPPLRTGTIVMGVPRDRFVVLGADRLWSNALPKVDDPPSERQGRQLKIAVHEKLPLAVAVAGIASLGPEQDTVERIRALIAPLDRSRLHFDGIVEVLRADLQERIEAIRGPARRALEKNPNDAAARIRLRVAQLTLLIGYVADGRAVLGTLELADGWKAKQQAPPRGAVAWPDALDDFYAGSPYARASAMFGAAIQSPAKLAQHVRRVIEAGIREDARLYEPDYRHVDGPVDVVVIDATGARCVPGCQRP
jgi:hypothetical protein